MATDPVCGMQVDQRTAAGSSVFEGGKYYFCSVGCRKKFVANPSAYLGTPAAGGTRQTEHAHPHAKTRRESPDCAHEKPVVPGVAPHSTYTVDVETCGDKVHTESVLLGPQGSIGGTITWPP